MSQSGAASLAVVFQRLSWTVIMYLYIRMLRDSNLFSTEVSIPFLVIHYRPKVCSVRFYFLLLLLFFFNTSIQQGYIHLIKSVKRHNLARFLFQTNAVLLNLMFVKESRKNIYHRFLKNIEQHIRFQH